jgi:hypothetical protein
MDVRPLTTGSFHHADYLSYKVSFDVSKQTQMLTHSSVSPLEVLAVICILHE